MWTRSLPQNFIKNYTGIKAIFYLQSQLNVLSSNNKNHIYKTVTREKTRNNSLKYLYMSNMKKLTEGEGGGGGGGGEGGNGENFPIVITSSRCKLFCRRIDSF